MDPDKCKRFDPETGTHPFEPCHMPCRECGYGEHLPRKTWNAFTGHLETRCAWCDQPWLYPTVTVCEAREAKEQK